MNANTNSKTEKQTKVPFFARNRKGKALVIKTRIKAGAGAAEEQVK